MGVEAEVGGGVEWSRWDFAREQNVSVTFGVELERSKRTRVRMSSLGIFVIIVSTIKLLIIIGQNLHDVWDRVCSRQYAHTWRTWGSDELAREELFDSVSLIVIVPSKLLFVPHGGSSRG